VDSGAQNAPQVISQATDSVAQAVGNEQVTKALEKGEVAAQDALKNADKTKAKETIKGAIDSAVGGTVSTKA
jgi:hypothetical protein